MSDLDDVLVELGEAEKVTVFAPYLPRQGARCELRGKDHEVVRYPAYELIPNFPVPLLWHPGFWRALRQAEPRRYDVFVSHTRFFLSSVFALLCARVCSRPLLHVEHGSDYVQLSGRLPRLAARLFDWTLGRLLLRKADGVVAISEAAAAFVGRLARREATVVYRGVRLERLDAAQADPELLAWAGGRSLVTFVGRLIDGKGVADLLHAYAQVESAGALLCVVGDGPRRGELEVLAAELGVSERVRFLGYLPESSAWAVMCASDIVVNPSYTEGLPTSVLEAALLGKAILATGVGGTAEIVSSERSAILFAPRDVAALRAGLERLLGDRELRQRLGAEARAEASGRFDWGIGARRFAEIARMLLPADPMRQGSGTGPSASTCANTDS